MVFAPPRVVDFAVMYSSATYPADNSVARNPEYSGYFRCRIKLFNLLIHWVGPCRLVRRNKKRRSLVGNFWDRLDIRACRPPMFSLSLPTMILNITQGGFFRPGQKPSQKPVFTGQTPVITCFLKMPSCFCGI